MVHEPRGSGAQGFRGSGLQGLSVRSHPDIALNPPFPLPHGAGRTVGSLGPQVRTCTWGTTGHTWHHDQKRNSPRRSSLPGSLDPSIPGPSLPASKGPGIQGTLNPCIHGSLNRRTQGCRDWGPSNPGSVLSIQGRQPVENCKKP